MALHMLLDSQFPSALARMTNMLRVVVQNIMGGGVESCIPTLNHILSTETTLVTLHNYLYQERDRGVTLVIFLDLSTAAIPSLMIFL